MVKPPKQKTNDEEKLYVQRPVGEQFRGAPGKQHKRSREF
jgi:DnaJ family protein C protein 8